jgi:hypothetical protein
MCTNYIAPPGVAIELSITRLQPIQALDKMHSTNHYYLIIKSSVLTGAPCHCHYSQVSLRNTESPSQQ